MGVQQRAFAQAGGHRLVKPRRVAVLQQAAGDGIVEHHAVIGRTQQDAGIDIGQQRLEPQLLLRQPGGFPGDRLGEIAAGGVEPLGQRLRRRRQVAEVAGGLGIGQRALVGMGQQPHLRRQRLHRPGQVLVEQPPDPGDQTEHRKARRRPAEQQRRRIGARHGAGEPEPEPAGDQRQAGQRQQGKEQEHPQPQAHPRQHHRASRGCASNCVTCACNSAISNGFDMKPSAPSASALRFSISAPRAVRISTRVASSAGVARMC